MKNHSAKFGYTCKREKHNHFVESDSKILDILGNLCKI